MNTIRIIQTDSDHAGPKAFLGIEREPGEAYYTLKAENVDVLAALAEGHFADSVYWPGIKDAINEAVSLNGGEVALPGRSDRWLDLIGQNRELLGKYSRRPLTA